MNIWLIKYALNEYAEGVLYNVDMGGIRRNYMRNMPIESGCIGAELGYIDDGPTKVSNVVTINSGGGLTCVDEYTKIILEKEYSNIMEFYPMKEKGTGETKYIINLKAINDAFDDENSECTVNSGILISSVQKYVFKENVLEYDIFNCYEMDMVGRLRTYCNDNYKKLIEDNNITGYKFIKIFEIEDK